MKRSLWWKGLLFFKDKVYDEMFYYSLKRKFMMKVWVYVKKLLDVCSLWNVKFCDYKSYNILWEEVYEE